MNKKIGIVGLGKMGIMHLSILSSMKNIEVTCVADKTKIIGKGLQKYLSKIRFYSDYKEMIDKESLDGVFITTPVFLHVPISEYCINKNIPFFLEKPAGLSDSDCKKLTNMKNISSVINMVGYCKREQRNFSILKDFIESNLIGKIKNYKATYYKSSIFKENKGWRFNPRTSGGGAVMGFGTHLIDLIFWIFGSVDTVSAEIKSIFSKEVEDSCRARLNHKLGISGQISINWSIPGYRKEDTKFLVIGTEGIIYATNDYLKFYLKERKGKYNSGWTTMPIQEIWKGIEMDIGGYYYTSQNLKFVNALISDEKIKPDIFDAYEVHRIVEGIYSSSKKDGELININD